MADAPLAPVNNAFKFFIANIDFQTTSSQVNKFFCAFGNVNHVKLIPHASSSNYNGDSGDAAVGEAGGGGARQRHKGYGFLFMLDEPSTLALERYVNAFPENKIEMLGRKGVFVKRQVGMGRDGGAGIRNTNVGRGNNDANSNSANTTNYQHSWGQYLSYNAQQLQYNTAESGYDAQHARPYSQVNGTPATYPQQLQAGITQSSQGSSDYYALQVAQQQQQQAQSDHAQAPQHLLHSTIEPTSSSLPTHYLLQQYPNGSIYPVSYQGNYQAVPPQSLFGQHVIQPTPMYTNQAQVYSNQHLPTYQQQQLLPSQPPLITATTTLGYSQTSHEPSSQNIQLNRWDQWQQQQQQRSMEPLHHPMRGGAAASAGGGGRAEGGGKWNGRGMIGGFHRGTGGGGGEGGSIAGVSGRNGKLGRRDQPY